eukprot:gene4226-3053_t
MINTAAARPGEYWSNKKGNEKQFKNYGLKIHKPSKWTYFKFELKRFYCGVQKPRGGYTAFGKRWHRHCNPKAQLSAMKSQGITSDHVKYIVDPIFLNFPCYLRWSQTDLPAIDVVLSHNHYDHLDSRTIRTIHNRSWRCLLHHSGWRILLPWGIPEEQIMTLDWWEELTMLGISIACVPSQHWSLHGLFDRNESLWCGWKLMKNETTCDWKKATTFYFTGDTAFNQELFEQIHYRFPRIDIAALPIGAYSPRKILYTEHVDPEHAVEIFRILGVKKAFGVHWGTFELSGEPLDEPPEELLRVLKSRGISTADFQLIRNVCVGLFFFLIIIMLPLFVLIFLSSPETQSMLDHAYAVVAKEKNIRDWDISMMQFYTLFVCLFFFFFPFGMQFIVLSVVFYGKNVFNKPFFHSDNGCGSEKNGRKLTQIRNNNNNNNCCLGPGRSSAACGLKARNTIPGNGGSEEIRVLNGRKEFHFLSALSYAIISPVPCLEAGTLLQWVVSRWAGSHTPSKDSLRVIGLTQVEFFFFGTDNGHLFAIPILPSSALQQVASIFCEEEWCNALKRDIKSKRNGNCGPRQLLHQHRTEEPVLGMDTLGTLVASASSDASVAISIFYPQPHFIVAIPHQHAVRCLKLWEGKPFIELSPSEDREESAAVYVFTGDANATMRLWRVDEDNDRAQIQRVVEGGIHCLTLDGNSRFTAGVSISLHGKTIRTWSITPLLWDEDKHTVLATTDEITVQRLRSRIERLVNHHVWVRDMGCVSSALEYWGTSPPRTASKNNRVISNEAEIYASDGGEKAGPSQFRLLRDSLVTVSFEEGELRKDITLPVSCVEPVVYPLAHLRMPMAACFAIQMLENSTWLITSSSDSLVQVWLWDETVESYILHIVAGERGMERSLGKHIAEWHLHKVGNECFLKCSRRFALQSSIEAENSSTSLYEFEGCASGISCMVVVPFFSALFVVGVFEAVIQTFRLAETQGCEVPPNFLYNGHRTVQLSVPLLCESYAHNSSAVEVDGQLNN